MRNNINLTPQKEEVVAPNVSSSLPISPGPVAQGFSYREEVQPRNRGSPRWFRPLTKGGLRSSIITLTSTAVGGGMLTLPYCLAQVGIIPGVIMLVMAGYVSIISQEMLMLKTVESGAVQYGELVGSKIKEFGILFDALLCFYGLGVQVVYLLFVADFAQQVTKQWVPGVEAFQSRDFWIWSSLLVVVPLGIPKKLTSLRYCSILAAVTLTYMTLLVVIESPHYISQIKSPSEYTWFNFDWNFFEALGNFIFVYNCHLNVVPVASEMAMPTSRRISSVAWRAVVVQVSIYIVLAIAGYLSFAGATKNAIVDNYAEDDNAALFSKFLLLLTLLIAMPINLNPTLRSLLRLFDVTCCAPKPQSAEDTMNAVIMDASLVPRQQSSAASTKRAHDVRTYRAISSLVFMLTAALLASHADDPAKAIGLISAFIGTLMMMIFPGWIYGQFGGRVIFLFCVGAVNFVGAFVIALQFFGAVPSGGPEDAAAKTAVKILEDHPVDQFAVIMS